jgi:putative ABC transport system permease protein
MLNNYIKTAIRSLFRHKVFSSINILGFAFSIAVCIVIILFVIKENSYDNCYPNASHIYKLIASNSSTIDYRLKSNLVNNYSEIKGGCICQVINTQSEINYNLNNYFEDNIMSADNDYFKIFNINFIYGNIAEPFRDKNSAILTESLANKIFGKENPVGKEIVLNLSLLDTARLVITGVIKDFSENSSNKAGFIVNADNDRFKFNFSRANNDDPATYRYLFNVYLLIKNNSNVEQVIKEINNHPEILYPYEKQIGLISLRDIYLSDKTTGNISLKGNSELLRILIIIGVIILTLASINYINLTLAQQKRRNKEIGIRKTVGAGKNDIITGLITESIVITLLAFLCALIFVEVTLPYFSHIFSSRLSLQPLLLFPLNIIIITSVLVIGAIAGLIPSLILSSFNPVKIFSGNAWILTGKGGMRNVLTVFQFTVSIALIFCLIVIQKQISFVKHKDLGFNKEQLLSVDLPHGVGFNPTKTGVLINELKQNSNILDISASYGAPGKISLSMGSGIPGKDGHIRCIIADSTFVKTFGIHLISGRSLLPGDIGKACMINESAYKYYGWNNLVNKIYNNGRKGGFEVIGVVKDFHFSSLREPIEPACIMFVSDAPINTLSIRMKSGSVGETMNCINKTWKKIVPDYPLKYHFYDDFFNEMYIKEEQLAQTIGLFATLAISISCMGILGLVIFASERRAKEIGIRKVHGAKVSGLMYMLNKDFLKWVLLSSVIALPLGWYAMNRWLQDFAYKTDINWWVYLLAGLSALLIAFLTVSWQTWRTVKRNPIEVLRYE